MKKTDEAGASLPTREQIVGRRLRLLRQERSWSQPDLVEKVRPFGYEWSQATVTRLEGATRPIRLNELVDLAALFEIPLEKLLEPLEPGAAWDDPGATEREIASLTQERDALKEKLDEAQYLVMAAAAHEGDLNAQLARINGRLGTLMRWHSQAAEQPGDAPEGSREQ
jgi:transcriptional regulator with XRE-family HTH domain